jgi:EamA domain-containing membrane protein RarD
MKRRHNMKFKTYTIAAMLIFGSIGLFVRGINLPSSEIALFRGIIGSTFLLLSMAILKNSFSWKAYKAQPDASAAVRRCNRRQLYISV